MSELGNADARALNAVSSTLDRLPLGYLRTLVAHDVSILPAEGLAENATFISRVPDAGKRATIIDWLERDLAEAAYFPDENVLLLPRFRDRPNEHMARQFAVQFAETFLHEIGHAIFDTLFNSSQDLLGMAVEDAIYADRLVSVRERASAFSNPQGYGESLWYVRNGTEEFGYEADLLTLLQKDGGEILAESFENFYSPRGLASRVYSSVLTPQMHAVWEATHAAFTSDYEATDDPARKNSSSLRQLGEWLRGFAALDLAGDSR